MLVTDRLGIQTSRHTILRCIMALPPELVGQVIELGIDDFSFRRGRKFGTILVNMQTHQVLDLLPDRTADTSAAWMRLHPEIELVSRDRGGDYASAAAAAVPQAVQCADRFHLYENLGEAVEGTLARHLAVHRKKQVEQSWTPLASPEPAFSPPKVLSKKAALSQAKREERLARYQHVVALRKQGFSQTAIASQVGLGHATVSRWLRSETFASTTTAPAKDCSCSLSQKACPTLGSRLLHRRRVTRVYQIHQQVRVIYLPADLRSARIVGRMRWVGPWLGIGFGLFFAVTTVIFSLSLITILQ